MLMWECGFVNTVVPTEFGNEGKKTIAVNIFY